MKKTMTKKSKKRSSRNFARVCENMPKTVLVEILDSDPKHPYPNIQWKTWKVKVPHDKVEEIFYENYFNKMKIGVEIEKIYVERPTGVVEYTMKVTGCDVPLFKIEELVNVDKLVKT